VRSVVVDANVFVKTASLAVISAIRRLRSDLRSQSLYDVAGDRLASMIRDLVSFPGVQVIDDCPWHRIFELWPNPLPSLADASIAAVATTNPYDAIATFDQKLERRAKGLGVAGYWQPPTTLPSTRSTHALVRPEPHVGLTSALRR